MKTLRFWPVAWTLATFSAVVFTLDALLGVLFPNWWVMQTAYEMFLPGYTFISWGAYFLGLVEVFIGGILTAVLFVPIWNFFAGREETKTAPTMTPASQHH
jgi:hypothetical protein